MITEFNFELTKPIKYHAGGDEVDGTFITLTHPSYKQMDKCVPLKQAFYRAAAAIADEESTVQSVGETTVSPDEQALTAEGLMSLFYQSDENMLKIILYGVELFKSNGVAKLDGSTNMTHNLVEEMSQDDLENMLGQYMVNFILASSLSKAGSR